LWLLGGLFALLLLLLAGLLLVGQYLSSPTVINKIQQVVAEQAGIKLEFQAIDLDYFPQPAISLQQANLTIPDYGQGTVDEISLSPVILSLLVGDLRLGRLSLEKPEFSLNVPVSKSQKPSASSGQDDGLEASLAEIFAMLRQVSPDFDLVISKGQLKVGRDQQPLIEAGDLNLHLALAVTDSRKASVTLRSKAAVLNVRRNGHKEALKGVDLNGSVAIDGDTINLALKRLALDEPGLDLSGNIEQASGTPSVTLDVSGKNIDVDETRRIALALAGDISIVDNIFNYLRGGTVAQINVRSQGRTADELGELKNIHIEGKLQNGSVSIPEIELDLTETVGDVLVADGILQGTNMSTRLEGSTGHDGTLKVGLADGVDLFQLELMLSADLAQAKQILERIVVNPEFIEEVNRITRLQGTGAGKLVLGDSLDNLNAEVDVSALDFIADYQRVPFPIKVTSGQVTFEKNLVNLKEWQGAVGDSEFSKLSCRVALSSSDKDPSQGLGRIELGLDGTLEEDLVKWLSEAFAMPKAYAIRSPLKLSAAQIDWQGGGESLFKGGLSVKDGPDLALDIAWQSDQLNIHALKLKDQYSDADISLGHGKGGTSLNFSGALQHETLNALFVEQVFGKGRVEGDFSVKVHEMDKAGATATGHLKGANLLFTLPSGDKVAIQQAALAANGDQVDVDLSKLSWQDLTWDPVKATIDLSQEKPRVRVAEANLCGLNAPGVWTIDGETLALDVKLNGKSLDVTTVSTCVEREQVVMTGTLDLSGQVSGEGQANELIMVLQGPLQATFSNGLIKQGKTLARVLEVLNVTEIVKGRLPSLNSKAFAYTTINLQGEFHTGKLLISKIDMDGETLDVLGQGEIDLVQKTIDVELLAAPFQTVDTVVKNIPGVNYLMAGSLVAIPVSIKGPLDDPKVRVLSASSVGSSLLRLGERTIKSPLKLIETFTPKGDSQGK
jgi:hypothetical protein